MTIPKHIENWMNEWTKAGMIRVPHRGVDPWNEIFNFIRWQDKMLEASSEFLGAVDDAQKKHFRTVFESELTDKGMMIEDLENELAEYRELAKQSETKGDGEPVCVPSEQQ